LFQIEEQLIQEQIIELLPVLTDINAISEELNKYKMFEVILVPSVACDNDATKSHTGGQT
jgi:kinesin family protein 1